MFCEKCGAEIPENSRFCQFCGAEISDSRPQKRSERPPEPPKPPPLVMRIILVLCALILFCTAAASLLVNFFGAEAEVNILSTSMDKQMANEKYLYRWDVTYEFYANGKRYVDSDELTGPRGSINTFGYHVSYLPFAPEVSRLTRGTAVQDLKNPAEKLRTGAGAVLCFLVEVLVGYFLLWVAFPKLPFFGLGRRKRK